MIKWLKKWWRLWKHGECPRCQGGRWRHQGGMCLGRVACERCGWVRGYDSYEDAVIKDCLDHGYPGMPR